MTARLLATLARATLRHWAVRCGWRGRNLGRLLVGVLAVAVLGAAAASAVLSASLQRVPPAVAAPVELTLVLSALLGGCLAVIAVQSSGAEDSRLMSALRPLPISDRLLAIGVNAPLVALLLALTLLCCPPLAVASERLTGAPLAAAALALAASLVAGTGWGLGLLAAARAVLARRPGSKLFIYPAAVAGWAALAAASGWWLRQAPAAGSTSLSSSLDVVLVWPSAAAFALSHGAVWFCVLALAWLGFGAAAYQSTLPVGFGVLALSPFTQRWSARGRWPLFRLELFRLLRSPRILASMAASSAIGVAAIAWLALSAPELRSSILGTIFLPEAIALAHVSLVSRGRSRRHRPPALQLGYSPRSWGLAVAVAGVVPPVLIGSVFAGACLWITRDLTALTLGMPMVLFAACAGAALGALVMPGADNSGGEAVGLAGLGLGFMVFVYTAGQAAGTPARLGLLLGLVSPLLLALPPLLEEQRWRADIGIAAKDNPLSHMGGHTR